MNSAPRWAWVAVWIAVLCGSALLIDSARSSSATYDEVAYLKVACHWWRTGEQSKITRMGSPLLFWKLQQAPTLFMLDHTGRGKWIDDPVSSQSSLLPAVRIGSIWIWLVGILATAVWSRVVYGPKAMAFAAWLFCLSPNILAHGSLATMETPLLASSCLVFFCFWKFLTTGSRRWFFGSAIFCGIAFSCKFTAVVYPPLLGLAWILNDSLNVRRLFTIPLKMLGFVAVLIAADFVAGGFALLPISERESGEHPSMIAKLGPQLAYLVSGLIETPVPQDWAGFAKQVQHQSGGGSSYLLGVRRERGWKTYYLIALAVKVPLSFWLLLSLRASANPVNRKISDGDEHGTSRKGGFLMPALILGFLAITSVGSSRNYGVRYLLPISPVAIVWISSVAERPGWRRKLALAALGGQAIAVASIHPYELTYFNPIGGGTLGGRKILADSNLDWGQGLRSMARLQIAHPEFRDLTFYYFGDTEPRHYGVVGKSYVVDAVGGRPGLPERFTASTSYVAVSASLQWGPWGPRDYFKRLEGVEPIEFNDDQTIAIYRTSDLTL